MSARRWKRTRTALRPCEREIDAAKRAAYRVPWWLRPLAALSRRFRTWHRRRWLRMHETSLRAAMKRTAHFARRVGL